MRSSRRVSSLCVSPIGGVAILLLVSAGAAGKDAQLITITNNTAAARSEFQLDLVVTPGTLRARIIAQPGGCPFAGLTTNSAADFVSANWGLPACVGVGQSVTLVVSNVAVPPGTIAPLAAPGNWGVGNLILPADAARSPAFLIDPTLDWVGHKRDLTYAILDKDGGGPMYTNPDACAIPFLNPDGSGAADVADPTPATAFTLGDAARVAADIWCLANTGWTLIEMPPPVDIEISKESFGGGGVPSMEANVGALATHAFGPPGPNGESDQAWITFNSDVPWGLNSLAPPPVPPLRYDPIIVMLHEFGHCFRLDHPDLPGAGALPCVTAVIPAGPPPPLGFRADGPVMCARIQAGVHRLNDSGIVPDPVSKRSPEDADIIGAMDSAAMRNWPVPTLSEWGMIVMALLIFTVATIVIVRRRRPAAA